MQLFLTSVLPFLAHNHPSAAAFLTCRHRNYHSSIIPEFLSDEKRVGSFCEARQQNQHKADNEKQYKNLFNLFVQTPLMQFSPSLIASHKDCVKSILIPLLKTKYFTRSLQRCSFVSDFVVTINLLQLLSKVQSLTKLEIGSFQATNDHLEIIINYFPSLETLTIGDATCLDPTTAVSISSPPPPATKTLRSLTLDEVDPLFATQFVPHFPNLKKLDIRGKYSDDLDREELDVCSLSSSLPLLTDLSLRDFLLKNIESLKNLVHLCSLKFFSCDMSSDSLSFLTQENSLPHLTTLHINNCQELPPSSFASLAHVPNLQVLAVGCSQFNTDCLQYLEDMVHLRMLHLSGTDVVGDSRSLKTLMQNSFQLEELDLYCCGLIGNQGAIAGALYSTHSRLRFLFLGNCSLVDDDLNGIGALKNTLEVLEIEGNEKLTNEALVHCRDLVKLKRLKLCENDRIDDLSPLKDYLNLEDLDVSCCEGLTDDSFRVFSEEPNSFANLSVLDIVSCKRLTEKVFEHLSNNNHLVYQLKELHARVLLPSVTARDNVCQLKRLSRFYGILSAVESPSETELLAGELMRSLKNLDRI